MVGGELVVYDNSKSVCVKRTKVRFPVYSPRYRKRGDTGITVEHAVGIGVSAGIFRLGRDAKSFGAGNHPAETALNISSARGIG